jgi:hypothetical protein
MNNQRRKAIGSIQDRLEDLKLTIESLREDLEAIRDEEQEYFDNMPESFQQADRGQRAEEVIGFLDDAVSDLDGLDLENISQQLEQAAE